MTPTIMTEVFSLFSSVPPSTWAVHLTMTTSRESLCYTIRVSSHSTLHAIRWNCLKYKYLVSRISMFKFNN
jgi:hypothetical protein